MKTISITISVVLLLAICTIGFVMNKSEVRKNVLTVPSPLEIQPVSVNKLPDNESNLQNSDWYSTAMNIISEMEYNIIQDNSSDENNYVSTNRANNMRFIYHKDGFTAMTRTDKIPLFDLNDKTIKEEDKEYGTIEEWSVDLKLEGLSKELQVTNYELRDFSNSELKASGNKAFIENENIRIDYTNTKEGMMLVLQTELIISYI